MMTSRFDPWTTSLGEPGAIGLSRFWRERMKLLKTLRSTNSRMSRRDWLRLGTLGAAAATLPTFKPARSIATGAIDDKKGPTGTIYARTIFFGPDPAQPNVNCESGILAVPPAGGQIGPVFDKLIDMIRVSPDGKKLAFALEGATHLLKLGDEKKTTFKLAEFGANLHWSPDGKQLLLGKSIADGDNQWTNETWRVNVNGKNLVKLDIPKYVSVCDWSRAGDHLLAMQHEPKKSNQDLILMRPDGLESKVVSDLPTYFNNPRLSPDGRKIVFGQQVDRECLWVLDIKSKEKHLVYEREDDVPHACWSPDGKYLAVSMFTWKRDKENRKFLTIGEGDSRIEVMTAEGKDPARVTPPVVDITEPDWGV